MRNIIAAGALVLLSSAPLHAEPITLTVEEAGNILSGLLALDEKYDRVVKVKDQDTIVRESYKLGALRWTITHNIANLREVIEPYSKGMKALQLELSDENGVIPEKSPAAKQFAVDSNKAYTKSQTIDLTRIKERTLNVGDPPDGNPIPNAALANMSKILDASDK